MKRENKRALKMTPKNCRHALLSSNSPIILKTSTSTPWVIHGHFTVLCSLGMGNLNEKCQVFPVELQLQELYL